MNHSLRIAAIASIALVAIPGFAQMATKQTMFDKLGGLQKIALIVDRAIDLEAMDPVLAENPRLRMILAAEMRPTFKFLATQSLAAASGGKQRMPMPSLFAVEAWLALDQKEMDRAWTHRMKAMDEAGIPAATQKEFRSWFQAETRKAKPMAPPMREMFEDKKSLYARLGGIAAICAVCERFVERLGADPVVTGNMNVTKALTSGRITGPGLKTLLIEQLAEAAGGPYKYTGRTMLASHKGLMITEEEWSATAKILKEILDEFKVPAREQSEVFEIIATTKGDIVGR
jgi:hemoglobin